jgi:hypothetical protein
MWSLGAVFLQIWTVLKGETVGTLFAYLKASGSMSTCYHLNPLGVTSWLSTISNRSGLGSDDAPRAWISNLLQADQKRC